MRKAGPKAGPDFRPFLDPFPQAPKTVSISGPPFGRRGTGTAFTLELALETALSGRRSKKCQMQSDKLYMASSHIFVQIVLIDHFWNSDSGYSLTAAAVL